VHALHTKNEIRAGFSAPVQLKYFERRGEISRNTNHLVCFLSKGKQFAQHEIPEVIALEIEPKGIKNKKE